MIDYQYSTPPEIAFKPELPNHVHGKASSITLYMRLKKNGLLDAFHSKFFSTSRVRFFQFISHKWSKYP